MNPHLLASRWMLLLLSGTALSQIFAAEPSPTVHYFDEVGFRHLSLKPVSGNHLEVSVRWAADPGSMSSWTGQGDRRENQIVFAAVVEEGQDRGAFFIAKGGESKMEVSFRPGQKMPPDPGILGVYRHVSDEKLTQLMKKEFQAAEDRLAATLKASRSTWPGSDKAVAGDWKSRWPVLRERWMKIAYQAPEPAKPKPGPLMPAPAKDAALPEKDANYWLKLAQATALGYSFMQQPPDMKSDGGWDGEYDDGFGGHASLRRSKDGKLRVTLSCTRGGELQGADLSGTIPAEAVKETKGEATAESVFTEQEGTKQTNVSLRRKGGFLWLEVQSKQPQNTAAWLDGIYRWSPMPVE
jgi:hypothetical protein